MGAKSIMSGWLATLAVAAEGVNDGMGHGHLPLWPLKFNAPIHQARLIVCFPCRRLGAAAAV